MSERWVPVDVPKRPDDEAQDKAEAVSEDHARPLAPHVERNLGQWTPGGHSSQWQGADLVLRPSGWAAFDVPFKALATVLFFLAPFGATGVVAGHGDPLSTIPFFAFLGSVQLIPIVLAALAPGLRIFFTRYIIDDQGIRVTTQILSKTESRIAWAKVTAIRHHRTFLDRVLGIERLQVVAYGERGTTLNLVGLRDAAGLRNATARRMRAHANAETLLSND